MGLRFNRHEDQELASLIVTADYLGQMAADDYPDELELLFNEFAESDRFLGIPPAQRIFKSVSQLAAGTGIFWEKVVKSKLEQEYHGVYRYLTRPDGSNPYLDAIARNLAIIARRHALATT